MSAAALRNDDERIAFVICHDIALVKQITTWVFSGMTKMVARQHSEEEIVEAIRDEIDYVRARIGSNRRVLEKIRLGKRKSLRLVPAEWETDLNGDGEIKVWEKYFFAIPRRGRNSFGFSLPSNSLDYYIKEYKLDAAIQVDQSDVLWALAYHQLIEGLLVNLRAFEIDLKAKELVLARPAMLGTAHGLMSDALLNSARMRRSVLAETGDDEEWIANPKQQSSAFPIVLSPQDFTTWGEILNELAALWQGRSMLSGPPGRGMLGELAQLCPKGMALNIAELYRNPPAAGTRFRMDAEAVLDGGHCQLPSAARPVSRLPEMAERAQRSASGDMAFLRHLYWTN